MRARHRDVAGTCGPAGNTQRPVDEPGSVRTVRILYVCTANICRSASAQHLMLEAVAAAPKLAGFEVQSAGTAARPGSPTCSVAPAMAGHAQEHRSRALTKELVDWADLVLPAARDHRSAIVAMAPSARAKTFTIRQSGRIADWILDSGMVMAARERAQSASGRSAWAQRFPSGDPRRDVAPLPRDLAGRWPWLVVEMDAARGMASPAHTTEPAGAAEPGRRFTIGRQRRAKESADPGRAESSGGSRRGAVHEVQGSDAPHPDDVPDPHVLGMGLHQQADEQIRASTDALVRLLLLAADQ